MSALVAMYASCRDKVCQQRRPPQLSGMPTGPCSGTTEMRIRTRLPGSLSQARHVLLALVLVLDVVAGQAALFAFHLDDAAAVAAGCRTIAALLRDFERSGLIDRRSPQDLGIAVA